MRKEEGEEMTWGEFKQWVEQQHVTDSDELEGIEFLYEPDECHRTKSGTIYIDGRLVSGE